MQSCLSLFLHINVVMCSASYMWFKTFMVSKPRVHHSWAINRTAARVLWGGGWMTRVLCGYVWFLCMCLLLLYLDLSGRSLLPLGEGVLNLMGCYRFRPGFSRCSHFVVAVHSWSYSELNLQLAMPAKTAVQGRWHHVLAQVWCVTL